MAGYIHGPGIRESFRELPDVVRADASNTIRNFVVLLDSFTTPFIGKK